MKKKSKAKKPKQTQTSTIVDGWIRVKDVAKLWQLVGDNVVHATSKDSLTEIVALVWDERKHMPAIREMAALGLLKETKYATKFGNSVYRFVRSTGGSSQWDSCRNCGELTVLDETTMYAGGCKSLCQGCKKELAHD